MIKKKKKPKKFTKAREGITKTPLKDATAAQLERLFKTVYLKYVVSLEDQLREDKAHLQFKENTIQILQEEIKLRNFEYKVAYEDCIKKNDEFIIQNGELIKERDEVVRAYNGLHMMGKIAQEQGINIEKHKNKLPENNVEFEQEHKLLESGKVQHSYKFKLPPNQKKEVTASTKKIKKKI
tara:strand:+ start:701 stop:1243 length:543 start_codon:yes stop_codon:yes gene_type:complete